MRKFWMMLLLAMGMTTVAFAQDRQITGVVSDESGTLPGVNVVVDGTTIGTLTDVDGKYTITVPNGYSKIKYSYLGYSDIIQEVGAERELNITMKVDDLILDEVVVTALGLETKRDNQGTSSSQVDGGQITKAGEAGLINSIAGKASNVQVTRSSGDPGASSYMQIRGQSTISRSVQPLIVLDGMPIYNSTVNTGNSTQGTTQQSRLNDLNPDDIESMEILKGAAAAAIWGTRAANGVIVIKTKKGAASQKKFNVSFKSSVSIDEANVLHPLQSVFGQGSGGLYDPNGALSWGDKIADRPGGSDIQATEAGQYYYADTDADGNPVFLADPSLDLYSGYFEAENGNIYGAIPEGGSYVYDANGNMVVNGTNYGGKLSTDVYEHSDEVLQTGYFLDNSVSLSGGDLNSSFYLSGSHLTQEGVVQNSDYERTTLRFNTDRRFNNFLKLSANANYSRINSNRVQQGSNLAGLYLGMLRSAPDFSNDDYIGTYYDAAGTPIFNRHRSYRRYLGQTQSPVYNNPYWTVNEQLNPNIVNRYIVGSELTVSPLTWLDLVVRAGIDTYSEARESYYPVSSGDFAAGFFRKESISEYQFNSDIFLKGARNLSGKINTNFVLGVNFNQRKFERLRGEAANFIIPDAPANLENATNENSTTFNYNEERRIAAGYGILGFDIDRKIFVNFTGRNEHPSSTNGQSFFYPSADVAFKFNDFLNLGFLSFGKLRASYGSVGVEPDPYLNRTNFVTASFQESWGVNYDASFFGGAFVRDDVEGNPDLIPERKTEWEIGADLRFLDDRISLGATYYQNQTEDVIFAIEVPASTGYRFQYQNAGTIENEGIEIDLNTDIIRTRDFRFSLGGNWATNENIVTDLKGTKSIFLNGFTGSSSRAVEGEPLGVLWGGRWDRNDNGDLILDENGFPQQALEEGILGDPNPDWTAAINSTIYFKGISLSGIFDMAQGGEMWGGTRGVLMYFGRHEESATETTASQSLTTYGGTEIGEGEVFRGVEHDFGGGPVALDQSWYTDLGGGFGPVGEQFIYDASWMRLRQVTLSYLLNTKKFQEFSKLGSVELSLTGRNLFLITDYVGMDPETNLTGPSNGRGLDYFNNPTTKSWVITLRVNY